MREISIAQQYEEVFVIEHEVWTLVEDRQDVQRLLQFLGMTTGSGAACGGLASELEVMQHFGG